MRSVRFVAAADLLFNAGITITMLSLAFVAYLLLRKVLFDDALLAFNLCHGHDGADSGNIDHRSRILGIYLGKVFNQVQNRPITSSRTSIDKWRYVNTTDQLDSHNASYTADFPYYEENRITHVAYGDRIARIIQERGSNPR